MNKQQSPLVGMLGIAKKAGKLITGQDAVLQTVRQKHCTVLYSCDASPRTKKQLRDKCAFYGAECFELPIGGEEFSRAVGRDGILVCAAVSDMSIGKAIKNQIETVTN